MGMKCQCCGTEGVAMFDICAVCRWENDPSLEDASEVLHPVGYELTEESRGWFSAANGDSPAGYYTSVVRR